MQSNVAATSQAEDVFPLGPVCGKGQSLYPLFMAIVHGKPRKFMPNPDMKGFLTRIFYCMNNVGE